MHRIVGFVLMSLFMMSATCDKEAETAITPDCDTYATVRDLRGLDGCRFVFELTDGTRLEPIVRDCIIIGVDRQEDIEADPLYNFEFLDGKKVKISYELQKDVGSFCMVGDIVKITCLTELIDQDL